MSESERVPLEPDRATLRSWLHRTFELLLDHLESLPDQPAFDVDGAVEQAEQLDCAIKEGPGNPEKLIETVIRDIAPRSFNTAGPGYYAYIPGGGIAHAAIADLIGNLTNRFTGVYAAAPLLARLEVAALRWLLDVAQYPKDARGILTSGGSLATMSALLCARETKLDGNAQNGVIYCSDQVHFCLIKAARLVGFPADNVRSIETGPDATLNPAKVVAAVRRDKKQGRVPAVLVGSAGTVNTGAVDPLADLADVAAREKLWYHVDAAYGGFFLLTERGRQQLRGMERSDSICLDPHKGLFLPYGTGCLLVRRGEDLKRAHGSGGEYLPQMQNSAYAQDFCEYSPELSRDYRGLRVWLPLQMVGSNAIAECLDEKLDLASWAAKQIEQIPALKLVNRPALSLFAFHMRGPPEQQNALTQQLLDEVLKPRRFMLSGTRFRGRFVLRICILSFRSHRDRLAEALEIIRDAASRISKAQPAGPRRREGRES